MAWDDTKQGDDLIESSEWNTMVTDQKGRVVGIGVNEAIADTSGNLPAAGSSGRIFLETDTGRTLYDNGGSWVEVGLSESEISVESVSTQGSQGTVPVSQGDGSLSMEEVSGGLERISDLDGLVAYKQSFNTIRNRADWIDHIFQNNESMADEITNSQVLTHYVFESENDAYDRFIDPNHNLGLFAYNNDSEPVISSVYEGAMFLAPTSFLDGLMTIESVADQISNSQVLMDAVHNGDAIMENNFGFEADA